MDKDLIVTIFVPTTDNEGKSRNGHYGGIGTAYPVADDLILTSRHVVQPDNVDTSHPLRLRWHYLEDTQSDQYGWLDIAHEDVVWTGKGEMDAALLKVSMPESFRDRGWGWISDQKPLFNSDWQSSGFARATKYDDKREPGEFSGTMEQMADKADYFQVNVVNHPENIEQWKGASGMPVFVNGVIMGVVASAQPNFNNKVLRVIPTWKMIVDDEDFRHMFGIDRRKQYLDETKQGIIKLLMSNDATDVTGLLAELAPNLSMDQKQKTEQIAEYLLNTSIERLFAQIEQVREKLGAGSVGLKLLGQIICLIIPVLVNPGVVESLRNRRNDPSAGLISLPVALTTIAEIIMAGVDRRPVMFRPSEPGYDWPEGVGALPDMPEGGRDTDGTQYLRDFRTELIGLMDDGKYDDFSRIFDEFMRMRFTGAEIRRRAPKQTQDKESFFDRYINQKLADMQRAEKFTYYYIMPVPAPDNARERHRGMVKELKRRYPYIVFLELDEDLDRLLNEQGTFLPMKRYL